MTQQRIIRGSRRVPGGHEVDVEVTEAYTDGTSRWEIVFVPVTLVSAQEADGLVEALVTAMEVDPFEEVHAVDVDQWKRLKAVSDTPLADLKRTFGGKG